MIPSKCISESNDVILEKCKSDDGICYDEKIINNKTTQQGGRPARSLFPHTHTHTQRTRADWRLPLPAGHYSLNEIGIPK